MLKAIALLLLLGIAGIIVYVRFFAPDRRACSRLAELCGPSTNIDACTSHFGKLRQGSSESFQKMTSCLGDARSCAQGTRCVLGAGFSAAERVVDDVIKGIGKALEK